MVKRTANDLRLLSATGDLVRRSSIATALLLAAVAAGCGTHYDRGGRLVGPTGPVASPAPETPALPPAPASPVAAAPATAPASTSAVLPPTAPPDPAPTADLIGRLDIYVSPLPQGSPGDIQVHIPGIGELRDSTQLAGRLAAQRQLYINAGTTPETIPVLIRPALDVQWSELSRVYDAVLQAKFQRISFVKTE